MQQIVRIGSLAKTLEIIEKTADSILQNSAIYKTQAEVEAYKNGFKTALDLIRKEYGIT